VLPADLPSVVSSLSRTTSHSCCKATSAPTSVSEPDAFASMADPLEPAPSDINSARRWRNLPAVVDDFDARILGNAGLSSVADNCKHLHNVPASGLPLQMSQSADQWASMLSAELFQDKAAIQQGNCVAKGLRLVSSGPLPDRTTLLQVTSATGQCTSAEASTQDMSARSSFAKDWPGPDDDHSFNENQAANNTIQSCAQQHLHVPQQDVKVDSDHGVCSQCCE
jgi:hypothetical protein